MMIELMPLRELIECSAKDIGERLLKLEDRLQTALEPHTAQKAQSIVVQEKKGNIIVSIDTNSQKNAGKSIVLELLRIQSLDLT